MESTERLTTLFNKNLPLFNALGDSIRQNLLLLMMSNEPLSVSELAAKMAMSRPTISHHLRILYEAKIIIEEKHGRKTYYKPQLGDYYYSVKELVDLVDEITNKEDCNDDSKATA